MDSGRYRYSALLDRLEGKDANNILQCYTDILPGRPTVVEHRAPEDDLRRPMNAKTAHPLSKLHALTIMAAEQQTHNYYMNVGPLFADPLARLLYAEIASIEEQHVTQYESIIDPNQTWMEQWLQHELMEVYNYYGCVQQEKNPRIKALWERFLDYELGQLRFVMDLFEKIERKDAVEAIGATELPDPIPFESQRDFVRETLTAEVDLRARGEDYVEISEESEASLQYREYMNSEGSPTEIVAEGYRWRPGTELNAKAA